MKRITSLYELWKIISDSSAGIPREVILPWETFDVLYNKAAPSALGVTGDCFYLYGVRITHPPFKDRTLDLSEVKWED